MLPRLLLVAALSFGVANAYTVQPGDTLYGLARKHGTTVEEIMRVNNLTGTTISVGQQLTLPDSPAPAAPAQAPATVTQKLGDLTVTVPASVREGDAFTVRIAGDSGAQARVRFTAETGEDVRSPAEDLAPIGAAGAYAVLGRVVLGAKQPVAYEVRLGDETITGSIPVTRLGQKTQHLHLAPSIAAKLEDPARAAEDAAVERAYARRTAQAWTKPFADPFVPAGSVRAVSTSFGQPRTYVTGGPLRFHYGIDYAAPAGTPLHAMNDGTVVLADFYPVRGGLVVIDHGAGVSSMYFHMRKLNVKPGDSVTRGQPIGEVGSTGLSTGAHLHLEVRVRGEATDPRNWTGRLLP